MSKTTLKQLKVKRDKLYAQLDEIETEIHKRTLIGYRAICSGDDYNYGGFTNYLFEDWGKRDAEVRANNQLKSSENGGRIEAIYEGDKDPDCVH